MVRLLTDGAEDGTASKFELSSDAPRSSNRRSGVWSFGITTDAQFLKASVEGSSEIFIRCARWWVNATDNARIAIRDVNDTDVTYLQWKNGDVLNLYKADGTLLASSTTTMPPTSAYLPPNCFVLIEVHYKYAVAGLVEVRVNYVKILEYSGDTKLSGGNLGYVRWHGRGYWDDIAINDASGSVDNTWCGDGRVLRMLPSADITTAFQRSGATGGNYSYVDEAPASTDYVYSDVPGAVDWYESQNPGIPAGSQVKRVWLSSSAKESEDHKTQYAIGLKVSGETERWETKSLEMANWKVYHTQELTQTPDNADWTIDAVNNLQIGVKVV